MNVIILSAGTRCQLVTYFMNRENGFDKVVTTDCSEYSPAIYKSDKHYIVPRMSDPAYLDTILKICDDEDINLMLPLQEDELVLIAAHKEVFEQKNILVSISSYDNIILCRDKYMLYKKLTEAGIPTIDTYDYSIDRERIDSLPLPLIAKERGGAGSVGLLKANSHELIHAYAKDSEGELIIQPCLDAIEYGVDVYRDFVTKEIVNIFIKKKLRMRSGETEKSVSVINDAISSLVIDTVNKLNLTGPIDVDVFEYNGNFYILEINPRFGGGYPHAYACGINFIKYLANNASGTANKPDLNSYSAGQVLLKYTDAMLIDEKNMF